MTADVSSASGIPRVNLLVSGETFLLREAEDELRRQILPEDTGGMNSLTVYGWDIDAARAIEFLQTMPFLAECRLLVIREIQKTGEWKSLIPYLQDPNPSSYLIMTSSELKKKDAAYKALAAHAKLRELRKPYSNAMAGWVVKRFKSRGIKIDGGLAEVLVSVAGDNLSDLANEIDKVSLHADDRKEIRQEDLDVVMPGGVSTVFNLLDALGDGRKREALLAVERLMETEGRPEAIIHMVARHYRQLLRGWALVEGGASPAQAARGVGIAYKNLQEKFARHLRRADIKVLERSMAAVSKCDRELKTGQTPGRLLLEKLTLELLA